MSRIGKMPITLAAGVDVTIADGNLVTVKGPNGTLSRKFSEEMIISKDGATVTVDGKPVAATVKDGAIVLDAPAKIKKNLRVTF